MRTITLLFASTAAVAIWSMPASALSPLGGGSATDTDRGIQEVQAVQQCWWSEGVRRCALVNGGPRVYGYRSYGGTGRPTDYQFGSGGWWRAMDREGRGGHEL